MICPSLVCSLMEDLKRELKVTSAALLFSQPTVNYEDLKGELKDPNHDAHYYYAHYVSV